MNDDVKAILFGAILFGVGVLLGAAMATVHFRILLEYTS